MIIETRSAQETFQLGKELGEKAYPGQVFTLIEWANLIEEILPQKRTEITIEKNLEEGFDYRKITVEETI